MFPVLGERPHNLVGFFLAFEFRHFAAEDNGKIFFGMNRRRTGNQCAQKTVQHFHVHGVLGRMGIQIMFQCVKLLVGKFGRRFLVVQKIIKSLEHGFGIVFVIGHRAAK